MESSLNSICQQLNTLTNSTGVYIAQYDKRFKPITEEDDEFAHIVDQDVLKYVYYSDDHDFLKNKVLEPETGVAYDVLKKDDEVPVEVVADPDAENPDEALVAKVILPKKIFVPEVVREKRMVFFREPRLGSWCGFDMSYKSSLNRNVSI